MRKFLALNSSKKRLKHVECKKFVAWKILENFENSRAINP